MYAPLSKEPLGIFPIIFLLFYIREKKNSKFVQNSYCFLFHNGTNLKSCTPSMSSLFNQVIIKLVMFSIGEETA